MSLLCYADGGGVHLTDGWRVTLCGRTVVDVPEVPRCVEALTCVECYASDLSLPLWLCLCGARNRLRDLTCRSCGDYKPEAHK